jgi:hypothetical protein
VIVECIRCGGSGRPSQKWKAIGYGFRHGRRPVAYLRCLVCGAGFYSSLPQAIEAAEPFKADRVQLLSRVGGDDFVPPAPTLFGAVPPQSAGFAKVGSAAKGRSAREVVDWARRAAGERDE